MSYVDRLSTIIVDIDTPRLTMYRMAKMMSKPTTAVNPKRRYPNMIVSKQTFRESFYFRKSLIKGHLPAKYSDNVLY